MVESSIPIAIMLLSWGWNARNVAAGGGGMKVVMVCTHQVQKMLENAVYSLNWHNSNSLILTLNVIMLNSEIFPPDADMT